MWNKQVWKQNMSVSWVFLGGLQKCSYEPKVAQRMFRNHWPNQTPDWLKQHQRNHSKTLIPVKPLCLCLFFGGDWPWCRPLSWSPCRWSCTQPRPSSRSTSEGFGQSDWSPSHLPRTQSSPQACWTERCTAGRDAGSGRTWPCRRARQNRGRPSWRGWDWTGSQPGNCGRDRNKSFKRVKKQNLRKNQSKEEEDEEVTEVKTRRQKEQREEKEETEEENMETGVWIINCDEGKPKRDEIKRESVREEEEEEEKQRPQLSAATTTKTVRVFGGFIWNSSVQIHTCTKRVHLWNQMFSLHVMERTTNGCSLQTEISFTHVRCACFYGNRDLTTQTDCLCRRFPSLTNETEES